MGAKRPDAVKGLFTSAQQQAELSQSDGLKSVDPGEPPTVEVAEDHEPARRNGAPQPSRPPEHAQPEAPVTAPPDSVPPARRLVGELRSRGEVELYGFRVAPSPQIEEIVQLSVRVPKALRHAIHAACARFDLTVTQFATVAFEQLLDELQRQGEDSTT